jgi:hypothetical protein
MNKYIKGQTIDFKFRSRDATGAAAALTGGTISIYRGNSTSQFTTGVTLTADFDSVTGQNHVRIVTTDAAYAPGADFEAVITAGTVGGVSVVGEIVHRFRITQPQTFYVDPTSGSDSNDGVTPETAFATIAGAVPGTVGGALAAVRSAGGKKLIKVFPTGDQVERNVIDLRSTATGNPPIDLDISGCRLKCLPTWNAGHNGSTGITFQTTTHSYGSSTVTATFNCKDLSHYFKTGDTVTIAGATPNGHNGTKTITVLNAIQVSFSTSEGGSGVGSGTLTMTKVNLPAEQIGPCISYASGSTITAWAAVVEAVAGQGTTSTFGNSAQLYSCPIGCRAATHTPARTTRILGGLYIGNSDAFYDSSQWTPTSPDFYEQYLTVEDAGFVARADSVVVNAQTTHVILRRCWISVFGPSDVDQFVTESRALVAAGGGRLDAHDCTIIAREATLKTFAAHAQDNNSELNLYRCKLQSSSTNGGSVLDIHAQTTATVRVHDCEYVASKVLAESSSTITIVPSHGADAVQVNSATPATELRSYFGVAIANLDDQLNSILGQDETGHQNTLEAIDGVNDKVILIQAKTDNLPAAFPNNFASLAITVSGEVTAENAGGGAVGPVEIKSAEASIE